MYEVNTFFGNLIEIGTGVALAVSACFVMWGAFLYMTAGGSPRRLETAKSAIACALTGLAVVLIARGIASMVQGAVA